MEHLHGEWLVSMCCDLADVCLQRVLVELCCLHAEWLVLICCVATCVSSWCLRNPAFTWGMAGVDDP